jgi:predicted nucleic acid-binding protein
MRCDDPDDQKFLDLAFASAATALLTRDKALLRLSRAAARAKLWIGTPAGFSLATAQAGTVC